MKMITSRQNALVKEIRALKDKKVRDESGLFVIEGVKTVKEALECGVSVKNVVCTEKGLSLIGLAESAVTLVTDDVFKSISDEVTPQGVIATAYKPVYPLSPPEGDSILLDGVSDPKNVGAIIRTAAAAGYKDLYLVNAADPFSPKAVRASMSGIYKVRTHTCTIEEAFSIINAEFIVADMRGENAFAFKPSGSFCLVIGNEGNGVSPAVKNAVKTAVSIPMQNGTESLNAAVSAGILMYALKNSSI